jgi:hypothetical protein
VTLDDQPVSAIALTTGGVEHRIFLADDCTLIAEVTLDPQLGAVLTYCGDYRDVDGWLLPFSGEAYLGDERFARFESTRSSPNASFADERFEVPRAARAAPQARCSARPDCPEGEGLAALAAVLESLDDDRTSLLPPLVVAPAFHALIREAKEAGATGLIVDLRDNPGGAMSECLGAAAAFSDTPGRLVSGLLRQTVRVEGNEVVVEDASGRRYPLANLPERVRWSQPSAVLVNAGNGSCAEFMAFDLQQTGVMVIGEATAGVADSTTTFVRLPNGDGLAITSATVRALDGSSVPARVTPERVIHDDLMALAAGEDGVLLAALQSLSEVAHGGGR